MSDPVEATLFELSANDDAAAPEVNEAPVAATGPVLLVTNRYNLLEFLSAGLVDEARKAFVAALALGAVVAAKLRRDTCL